MPRITELESVRLETTPEQKAALRAEAKRRGKPMQVLLREAITQMTGCPDHAQTLGYRHRKAP